MLYLNLIIGHALKSVSKPINQMREIVLTCTFFQMGAKIVIN